MFLMSYFSHSWGVCTIVPNNFRFLVCLSVCSLPYFLTEIRLSVISPVHEELSFSNFLDIFLGCLYISSKQFQISCMSFSLFIALLPYYSKVNIGYLQFWMSYPSQIFWRHSRDFYTNS